MSRVLKISMPDEMYEEFVKDARDNYDDCYWLKIVADIRISKGIAGAVIEDRNVQEFLKDLRKELIQIVNQKYKEDVAPLKREIMKYRMRGL